MDNPPVPIESTQGTETFRLARVRHDLRTPINHILGYSEILLEDAAGRVPKDFMADLRRIHDSGQQLMTLINQHLGDPTALAQPRDMHALSHDLRTPANHIVGYAGLLLDVCDDLSLPDFKPDLERIAHAAKSWLRLMEEHLLAAPGVEPHREKPGSAKSWADAWTKIQAALTSSAAAREGPVPIAGHLLLADDDPDNREILRRRLEKLGYTVEVVTDGEEALARLRAGGFDLALLDLVMPGLDGREILARMRQDPELQHLPVIMVSALDQMESIVQCIELGAEDYLAKPFDPVLLRARIGAALEKKRLRDLEKVYLRRIEEEQRQSERLLLNVLPQVVADRLKQGESTIVDAFPEASVLFADLVGFTEMSVELPPKVLVRLLDEVFATFDELVDRRRLEKIKTIGDAYMAVAGLPVPRADHAEAMARLALDMQDALRRFNASRGGNLRMRIGINSGAVIGGIIGRRKFVYDLWGDTVNTASRMESHGEAGRIQVTEATARLLEREFILTPRGTIQIKGKGDLATFWLEGLCPRG